MRSRFQNIENNEVYAECTILDSRYRNRGFTNVEAYEKVLQGLRNKLAVVSLPEVNQENDPNITNINVAVSEDRSQQKSIWDDYDEETIRIVRPENKQMAGIIELDKYLTEDYLDRKNDPLEWWDQRKKIYPNLYSLILNRFCVVATSVPCERIFSGTGQILNERRTLLESAKVSKLIFLHTNM
uniref:Zinc finger BED domain-containing protein 4-like n=1 Tax=Diabrotica virgifera virgifera TaxID=50390 RepID=A0A6P7F906_DIAVI